MKLEEWGNLVYRILILVFLACIAFGCSPQKRLNRKVDRVEKYALKHGLVIKDSVIIHDTLVVNNYTHDTTSVFTRHDSTIVINNDKVYLKYFYDTLRQEIYHEIECKGDTIIREIVVPVDKIKVIDKDNRYIWIVILLLITLIVIVLRKNYTMLFKTS